MKSDFETAESKFAAEIAPPPAYFPVNPNHNLIQQPPNPFPFTQQFFQQHHFLQPFFDDNTVADADNGANLLLPLSFKLGSGHETQRNDNAMIECWENQQGSAIKQGFWKPLNTEFRDEYEKECPEESEGQKRKHQEMSEPNQETEQKTKGSFFDGELEAIYRQPDATEATASGSALTAENLPANLPQTQENAEAVKGSRKGKERKRRKLLEDDEYASIGEFFESIVRRLMAHQEDLHRKFLETMERLERERAEREEAWRQQELKHLEREAEARAKQRDLASTREAAILSYLEKITSQKINLDRSNDKGSDPVG